MSEVAQSADAILPGTAVHERWSLSALLRDADGAPYFLFVRLAGGTGLAGLSGYRDELRLTGDGAAAELSATDGGLRFALDFAELELTGLDRMLPADDGVSLPDVTVAGTLTQRGPVTGQGWIERSRTKREPAVALSLMFDDGERLRLTDGDVELTTTGWVSSPDGNDWLPWGWRFTLPPARSLVLDPYSRHDVYEVGDRPRFLGAARLLGDDGPVGFAVAEALAATPPAAVITTPTPRGGRIPEGPPAFTLADVGVDYGDTPAVRDVTLDIPQRAVTALIGPSGSGKSTLIRALNRMNDLVLSATVTGQVRFHGQDLYSPDIDPVQVRRRIGMVFQKPNPFPKSIYDNVAFGPRALRMDDHLDERVEEALKRAALWDEVSERLERNAFSLSGGQQQRLIIARALATRPDVLLMDEPASALDPFSTARIEDLMAALREELTIVVVTHNMQQAARVADVTAFMTVVDGVGTLVECAPTEVLFTRPTDPRTEAYVTGRFG